MAAEDEGLLPPTMDPQTIYRRKADTSLLANFLYLFWTSHILWPCFFISRQRGEYQTVLGEIKADLNSHCSPNHRDGTRSDHLAWSCYLWIQASKGCPEVHGSPVSLQQCWETGNNRDAEFWEWGAGHKCGSDFCKKDSPSSTDLFKAMCRAVPFSSFG